MKCESTHYRDAGVDINAGYRAVELMRSSMARTVVPGANCDAGGFGGLFVPDLKGMKQPVLVSGTDGVGTKLKLAFLMDKHDTVGIDCVAMCVNDVLCAGAKPLFFLDYIAVGKNVPERVAQIVSGVAEGCVQAGCALIGGETAEMPGFYDENEYDLAGFSVGMVDKGEIPDKNNVKAGDVLIGLPSSGLHSNGFSLVRKVLDVEHADLHTPLEQLGGQGLGETLLMPTRIYVRPVLDLLAKVKVKSIAHITGGGFYENIPRALPENCAAHIDLGAWARPNIFTLLERTGGMDQGEMFSTFNMGVGMCLVLGKEDADKAVETLEYAGQHAFVMGDVRRGEKSVHL